MEPFRAQLRELSVLGVDVVEALPVGRILLASVSAGSLGWHELEDALEVIAVRKAKQLAKAEPTVERILFAWIPASRMDLQAQLERWSGDVFGMPPRSLDLPGEIDTIIVGSLAGENKRFFRWPGFSPFNAR